MKIVLIGFACSYKTSAGKLLANMLDCAFVDTDDKIAEYSQKTVSRIFADEGEHAFRETESKILLNTLALDNCVISCGGGSVMSPCFVQVMQNACAIWLTANASTVVSRLDGKSRPLFDNLGALEIERIMKNREPFYLKYAKITIATDNKTPLQVAEEIYNRLIEPDANS